jgi:anhydro-N-acetylmuramic acid kinase
VTEAPLLGVGLMSGTSLDGVDAALVRFESPTRCALLNFHSRPYSTEDRNQILEGIAGAEAPALARLHVRLADWAAEAVEALLAESRVKPSELGFIAMHGQTIWHEPPTVSWQLGEAAVLAERFGVRVVSNFRSRDVAAGGQGAPLVPIADILLFGHPEQPRVLLNIGGMANLTYVPRRAQQDGAFAFDTGPGMALIDALVRRADPGLRFDLDGRMARSGKPRDAVLERLLAEPYFSLAPPKSTGRELFGMPLAERIAQDAPGADGVATAVELTARSITDGCARWVPGTPEVVVSGGGVHHPLLMERLRDLLGAKGLTLRRFDDLFFHGDAKEAAAFALLGYLTLHGQPGNVPGATGAAGPRVLGQITPA